MKIQDLTLANFYKETYAKDLAPAIHFYVKICPYFHEFATHSYETYYLHIYQIPHGKLISGSGSSYSECVLRVTRDFVQQLNNEPYSYFRQPRSRPQARVKALGTRLVSLV